MMRRLNLCVVLFLLFKISVAQTIEVVATDTLMCKVENYKYLLTISFHENQFLRMKKEFEADLTLKNYNFEYFFEDGVAEEKGAFFQMSYYINFISEKEKNDFERKMNVEKRFYNLTLREVRVEYGEKEKIKLIEKIIKRGEEKAKLIAIGLNKKLGEIRNVKESYRANYKEEIPDNIIVSNYGTEAGKITNEKDEARKIKTLIITYDSSLEK